MFYSFPTTAISKGLQFHSCLSIHVFMYFIHFSIIHTNTLHLLQFQATQCGDLHETYCFSVNGFPPPKYPMTISHISAVTVRLHFELLSYICFYHILESPVEYINNKFLNVVSLKCCT